jgi:threonine dehydrogenase-like Zn-dependent dehydrogenase
MPLHVLTDGQARHDHEYRDMGKDMHSHTKPHDFQREEVSRRGNVCGWRFPGSSCKLQAVMQQNPAKSGKDAISEGSMNPGAMITSRIKMTEVEERGFRGLIDDKDNQVKILVEVGGEK